MSISFPSKSSVIFEPTLLGREIPPALYQTVATKAATAAAARPLPPEPPAAADTGCPVLVVESVVELVVAETSTVLVLVLVPVMVVLSLPSSLLLSLSVPSSSVLVSSTVARRDS